MKKDIYETPEIEFTKFEMEMLIMNDEGETKNGDIIHIGETTRLLSEPTTAFDVDDL